MKKRTLSSRTLQEYAGDRAYERGLDIYHSKGISWFEASKDSAAAHVIGTEEYTVRLSCKDDELIFGCSCPVGQRREFCKA